MYITSSLLFIICLNLSQYLNHPSSFLDHWYLCGVFNFYLASKLLFLVISGMGDLDKVN